MRNRRIGAAAVIVNDEGGVPLVKQTYGRLNWELPGGAGEAGESPDETVLREVREETGLDVAVSAQPRLRRAGRVQGVKYRCHVGGARVNAPSSTSETRARSIPAPAPLSVSIR
jgi:8-oxo-dGTP pyrophosphatase MutT (NUDIX family)